MNQRLSSLELLRFVAALLVVLFHLPSIGIGEFGVDIFFVISGYVMMLSTAAGSQQFLLKRLIRIVPLYWAATLAVFLIALLLPSLLNNTSANPVHLIKSLLFVPFDKNGTGHQPLLTIGWTLNFEMYFYLLFAIGCAFSHRYRAVITASLLVGFIVLLGQGESFLARVYSDAIVLEFAFGMLLYTLQTRDTRAALMLLTILALGTVFEVNETDRYLYFGIPAALTVWVSLNLPAPGIRPNLALALGALSYALYLSHPYVIRLFEKLLPWFDNTSTVQQSVASVLVIVVTLVSSHLIYRYFERPALALLRRRLNIKSGWPAPDKSLAGQNSQ